MQYSRLSKAFKFARTTHHVERYADSVRNCCRRVAHNINPSLTLKPRESSASKVSRAAPALAHEMRCWGLAFDAISLSRAFAQSSGDFLLRVELAPPPRQLVGA